MCRPPRPLAFAPLLVSLLALASVAVGQEPRKGVPKASSGPVADLERFRALEPAERLRAGGIAVRLAEIEAELAEADLKQPPAGQAKRVLELKVERARLRVEQVKDEARGRQTRVEAAERKQRLAAETEAARLRDLEAEL